jgi:nicotinic acid mononucleotide adenylyltransferase/8-oxo-dGTP pyrophosphatase MutT (NUDIX family)
MTKIVFGGTFDPWTPAHEEIVRRLHQKYADDNVQIEIIPSCVGWHRTDKLPLFTLDNRAIIISKRIEANHWCYPPGKIDLCLEEYNFARLCPKLADSRGFIDTLQSRILAWGPNVSHIKFVIGSDEYKLLPKWKGSKDLLKIAEPIVVKRGNEPLPIGVETLELGPNFKDISASLIRKGILHHRLTMDDYVKDRAIWNQTHAPAELRLHTPIFDVYNIPSDDPKFRPVCVNAPDWVTVMVQKARKFLCVTQKRWGTNDERTEFVTGMANVGEPRARAAYRELREETGLSFPGRSHDALQYIGSAPVNPAFMSNRMHYFYVNLDDAKAKQGEQKLDEHEKITLSWEDEKFLRSDAFDAPALMAAGWFFLDKFRKVNK